MGVIRSLGAGDKPRAQPTGEVDKFGRPRVGPGAPRWRKGNRQPDGTFPPLPPSTRPSARPTVVTDADVARAAEELTAEQRAAGVLPEAWATIQKVMRQPGRHAQVQLAAARTALEWGQAKPAARVETSGPGGGPVESVHKIVFGVE